MAGSVWRRKPHRQECVCYSMFPAIGFGCEKTQNTVLPRRASESRVFIFVEACEVRAIDTRVIACTQRVAGRKQFWCGIRREDLSRAIIVK